MSEQITIEIFLVLILFFIFIVIFIIAYFTKSSTIQINYDNKVDFLDNINQCMTELGYKKEWEKGNFISYINNNNDKILIDYKNNKSNISGKKEIASSLKKLYEEKKYKY